MTISGRATSVLERFPAHLVADDPSKTLAHVANEIAREIDARSSEVGRVRRAHRLDDAETEWDVRQLGELLALRAADFELLERRLGALRTVADTLLDDPGSPAADDARDALAALAALPTTAFDAWDGEPDRLAADQRLGNALGTLIAYRSELGHMKRQVASIARLHQSGNGTPDVLLRATATHLGLDIDGPIVHSDDRYWHLARCHDAMRLDEPQPPSDQPGAPNSPSAPVTPLPDVLALEDNSFRTAEIDPVPRAHGDRFLVTRSGWEEVPVNVRVSGVGDRTWSPMVVNIDSGVGVAFDGPVADGTELRFESVGVATLDDAEVTRQCFGFVGGVFADAAAEHTRDFVFADEASVADAVAPVASWALAIPYADAFERAASIPHPGGTFLAPMLRVGETRWAYLVGAAHFGTRPPELGDLGAAPRPLAGRFDRSVFDPDPGDGSAPAPSGEVGFMWEEREAFAARIWLPRRFAELDADQPVTVAEQIRLLMDRFRAAGVHVYVRYADERWVLGTGLLQELEATDGLGVVIAGTALWNDEIEQPTDTT